MSNFDLPIVSTQKTFITTHPDPTPPSSSLYIHRSSTKNPDGSENHVIAGVCEDRPHVLDSQDLRIRLLNGI